jgi:hypothetical protein
VRRAGARGWGLALVYALIGGVVGTLVGSWLAAYWPPLGHAYLTLGTPAGAPWTLNLDVIGVQVGAWMRLNLGGVVGVLLALGWFGRQRG